uniref:Carbohydrate ABC transporter permease n=1 Tax=Thermofilum pendens TaxID=2269 RepID=A0A7C4FBV9_THEPE
MKPRIKLSVIVINVAMWALALVWILPLYGLTLVSLMPYRVVVTEGWLRIPDLSVITLKNYIDVLTNPLYDIGTGLRNSFVVATLSTIIPVVAAALAAYVFANYDFTLKSMLFTVLLFVMMVPQQLCVVPLFFLFNRLGIYNTFTGIILLHSAWGIAWSTFFLRNYFRLLPRSIIDAARVDNASDFAIFRRIVLPLSKPALITTSVMQFTWVWNDLFYGIVFLVSKDLQVVTQKVIMLKGEFVVDWGLLSAGAILSMLPPLIAYALFNKYFIQGVAGWGVRR